MMSITQLTTAPSSTDIFNQMISYLVAQGIPADQWRKGGVGRTILASVASSFASIGGLISLVAGMGFLDTASGDFLTLLAFYVYGVNRQIATFANGPVLVSNSSGNLYTYAPGALIVINTITKKSFANISNVTLNPGALNISVQVQALEQGTASNSFVGQITTMGIADVGLSVNNVISIIGVDAWTDPILRTACRNKLGALSMMGPRGAYEYAISVATEMSGAPVNVNRSSVSPSSSTGIVTIYLASPTGPVTADDITGVETSIEAVARPDSVTANVFSATVVDYTPNLVVYALNQPGASATTIQAEVLAALASYQSTYPIGGIPKSTGGPGYMYDESIRAVAQAADPLIYAVDSIGGTDLSVPVGHVAAITSTVTVRLITNPSTT